MANANGNGMKWIMGLWRSVVAGLLVAGIVGAVVAGQNLAATASILEEVQRRLDRYDDRITYLERRPYGGGGGWQP